MSQPKPDETTISDPLRSYFERYCEIDEAGREAWLEAQKLEPQLLGELRSLIGAAERSGYLDRPVSDWFLDLEQDDETSSGDQLLGQVIGDYRLVRLIGSGGMGAVYLGERAFADFKQQVAVKVFNRPWYSAHHAELFRRERQILASLSHPNIAHLLDAGVTENNITYLVMEYVDGTTIDAHCRNASLSVAGRLKLVQQVCLAVAKAHAHLVVHRDIKPANVMVNAQGEVKLLDFGIAKLLDQDTLTFTGKMLMTYVYAAPEQRHGGSISTATDVYALGLLMHELLVGKRAAEDRETEPLRASQCAVRSKSDAHFHSGELPARPKQLAKILRGDLDTILQHALEAEPDRRYASAQALAEDIGRYLAGQAVLAHPPSGWYLARKFVARHRGSVAITGLLSLGILVSLILALLQTARATRAAQLATQQSQRAETVSNFLIEVMTAAADDLPRDQRPTPAQLATKAQARLTADFAAAPDVRRDLLLTFAKINLSQRAFASAQENLLQAKPLLPPELNGERQRWLRLETERLILSGEPAQAQALLLPFKDALFARADAHSVQTLKMLAWAYSEKGQNAEALLVEEFIAKRFGELLGQNHANALKARMDIGLSYTNLGRWLDADRTLSAVFASWQAQKLPRDAEYSEALAGLGFAKLFQAKFDDARSIFAQTLALRREIYRAPHDRLAHSLAALSQVELTTGKYKEAVAHRSEALSMKLATLGEGHPEVNATRAQLANAQISLGELLQAEKTIAPATRACNVAKSYALYCEMTNSVRTRLLLEQGKLLQAKASALNGIALSSKALGESNARLADPYGLLASTHAALNSESEANAAMAHALKLTGGSGLTWQKLRIININLLARFKHDEDVIAQTNELLIARSELVVNPHDQAQLWILRIEAMVRLNQLDAVPAACAKLATIDAPYLQPQWQARRKHALALANAPAQL